MLCKIAETTGQTLQSIDSLDIDEIATWLVYFKCNPPLRDHLNTCIAQIPQAIFNTNLGKGQKAHSLEKFMIDYTKAYLPTRTVVDQKIRSILGAVAKKG